MLSAAKRTVSKAIAKFARGAASPKMYCCICKSSVDRFHPYRGGWKEMPPLLTALNCIGSDVDNFSCPTCGAHDRERHLFLYLDSVGIWKGLPGFAVLHFAPEKRLSKLIVDAAPKRYVRADLYPTDRSIEKVDMLNMPYPSESFDLVMANHVLEHVDDDRKALSEIRRVLKPRGIAILQTPFAAKLRATFSDAGIDDDAGRLQAYGQEDHVRLYGADIFERFAESGLLPDIQTHGVALAAVDPVRYGVNEAEPLFLYRRGEM